MIWLVIVSALVGLPMHEVVASRAHELLASLSLEQKIAQLCMPEVQLNDVSSQQKIEELLRHYALGGVLLTQYAAPEEQAALIARLQEQACYPLLVAIDAEWGLAMRSRNALIFPHALTLGAMQDKHIIYEVAREIARQLRVLGIHINYAPVADVNCNPANPVIYDRSFGDDPQHVAECAYWYMRGTHDGGCIPCAKHFPGHGDTTVDSHHALPVINYSMERLYAVELIPFITLIQHNIPMIMTAHVQVPVLDNNPASMSSHVINDLLRTQLGYQGIVVTDGLKMKAVADRYTSAELALMAFKAGNDIMLQLPDPAAGIAALCEAVEHGEIVQEDIDTRVLRILLLKERAGLLAQQEQVEQQIEPLYTPYSYELQARAYQAAVTVVGTDAHHIALPDSKRVSTLLIQVGRHMPLLSEWLQSIGADTMVLSHHVSPSIIEQVLATCKQYDTIIVSMVPYQPSALHRYMNMLMQRLLGAEKIQERFTISSTIQHLCRELAALPVTYRAILFGTPYVVPFMPAHHLIVAYEPHLPAQEAVVQVLRGAYMPTGTLPIQLSQ